jgi:toxin ParE1/3/4
MKRKRSLSVSALAEADLSSAYHWYLNKAGVDVAERFLSAFEQACIGISASPSPGRLRHFRYPELAGIRSTLLPKPFETYLIFFRAEEKNLAVARVLHGMRDLEPLLVKGEG